MPIVPSSFARECVEDGWEFGVQPHYLLAVARLRSHIVDDTQGDRVGPFRLTTAEWNANRTDSDSDIDFAPTDITIWRCQCAVFALMTYRSQEKLATSLGRNPSVKELYLEQWPSEQSDTLVQDLKQALDDTASLLDPAVNEVMDSTATAPIAITDPDVPPPPPPPPAASTDINLNSIPKSRQPIAMMILDAFGAVPYGKVQQVAALANAIAESNLNPNAKAAGTEDSWGLFQLNRRGGLGVGHTPTELKDPATNIGIIIAETKKFPAFARASSVEQAVAVFVKNIERPSDIPGQTIARIAIAQKIMA